MAVGFFVAAASAVPRSAVAQIGAILEGRVVERGGMGTTGIGGATVELLGASALSTGASGDFRFRTLPLGRYVLRVEALGYADREMVLMLQRDTSLVIELDPSPVVLDSLDVRGRTVTVRGHVRERGTGTNMIHVEVVTESGQSTRTNATGRFRLNRFPAGPQESIEFRELGYMPTRIAVSADRDTSVIVEMEPDVLAQRMIAVQVARLDERSRPFRPVRFPVIDREMLLWMRNATVLDVVKRWYGSRIAGLQCIVIDEQQNFNGLDGLTLVLPEEVERIEVVSRGGTMLRIYTRKYIARLMAGGVDLARPLLVPGSPSPMCI